MSDFFSDRLDAFGDALDRRIDNEIAGEPMPVPYNADNNTNYVKDENGTTKVAGTGGRIINAVPNGVVYGGLALIGGVVLWKVL